MHLGVALDLGERKLGWRRVVGPFHSARTGPASCESNARVIIENESWRSAWLWLGLPIADDIGDGTAEADS